MPKIVQFEAPEGLGLRPTEVGITATAAAARRVGAEYTEAAAAQRESGQRLGSAIVTAGDVAVKYADHQQISNGLAQSALLLDNLTKSKDMRVKAIDPQDPAYGSKVEAVLLQWRDQTLEPALQKFQSGFTTENSQRWAEHFVGSTRNAMFQHTAAEISTAAGIGIQNSIRTFTNISSNTAIRNPEMVPELLGNTEHAVSGLVSSSPLRGVQGAKIATEVMQKTRQAIVESGAVGAIQKSADPEATAQQWIKDYPEYIDGHKAVALANNARQQIRARDYDQRANEARVEKIEKEISMEAADQYAIEARMRDPKLANDPIAQKVLNDHSMKKRDRDNVLALISAQLKPQAEARVSNENYMKFLDELKPGARDVDTEEFLQRVWDARTKNLLNDHHFDLLRKEAQDIKTPEGSVLVADRKAFMSTFGAAIDGAMVGGSHSALGKQQMAIVADELLQREAEMKKAGKNPRDLYKRSSSDYYDKDNSAAIKYGVSIQQAINYQFSIGGGNKAGMSKENPIILPKGTTPEKLQELGIKSGMWVIAPNETVARPVK